MARSATPRSSNASRNWCDVRRYQFSLSALLVAMFLVAVLASAFSGLVRQEPVGARMPPGFFVLMTIATPLALMILASVWCAVARRLKQRRPSEDGPDRDSRRAG